MNAEWFRSQLDYHYWGNKRLLGLVAGLDQARLGGVLTVKISTGKTFVHPVWEALQHLVNHGTYHRGQLTTLLRQVGATPVSTDLVVYYREQSGQL